MLISLAFELLTLLTYFNQLKWSSLVVLFQLSHVTALAEKSFWGGTELVFQNLLTLEVCTFCALHKLVSVVLISYFQVVKRIQKGFDFLFTLLDLAIELVTVPLQFFLLLGCLNDVVGLGVFTRSLDLSAARRMLLDQTFVLDAQVFYFVVPLLQLNLDLVPFFFSGL